MEEDGEGVEDEDEDDDEGEGELEEEYASVKDTARRAKQFLEQQWTVAPPVIAETVRKAKEAYVKKQNKKLELAAQKQAEKLELAAQKQAELDRVNAARKTRNTEFRPSPAMI